MDLEVPGALPTMLCRPPTINGTALAVANAGQVKAMPGITDVAIIPHTNFVPGGVAVRGRDVRTVHRRRRRAEGDVGPGPGRQQVRRSDVLRRSAARPSCRCPRRSPLAKTVEQKFTFHFRPGDPLETNCAMADVRAGSAEIWSSLKSPIWAQEQIAQISGCPSGR